MAPLDARYGTYRCPVCGHCDAVALEPEHDWNRIACTHCDTALDVFRRGPDSIRLSVRVAGEPATW